MLKEKTIKTQDGGAGNCHDKWYSRVYPRLCGFGLWLKGGELNTLPKEEYAKRPFRVLFARLSTYKDSAASATHGVLYNIASSMKEIFPDIAYLPPEQDVWLFEKYGVPALLGTQTKFGPAAFNLIGFSNSVAQELINIPRMLSLSGIPLSKKERLMNKDIPLLILGGANAFHCTALWGHDPVVDGIFTGDSPALIQELLAECAAGYANGLKKEQILKNMLRVPGFILPDAPLEPRPSALAPAAAQTPAQLAPRIVLYEPEETGLGRIPISRGCRSICSFCAESWQKKPYMEYSGKDALKDALWLKAQMGLDSIELMSFNFNMHTEIFSLMNGLSRIFTRVGLKSQRFDALAAEPELIRWLFALGKTSFSCGLEGISKRIRAYLNKGLDDKLLKESLGMIIGSNARELKIFLIATGREEAVDYAEFESMLLYIKKLKEKSGSGTRIIWSITPLVLFPWTPLENETAPPVKNYEEASARIQDAVKRSGFESRRAMSSHEHYVSQALARAQDERIMEAVCGAAIESKALFYGSIPDKFYKLFIKKLIFLGLSETDALKVSTKKEPLWRITSPGIDPCVLHSLNIKNKSGTDSGFTTPPKLLPPPCGLEDAKAFIRGRQLGTSNLCFNVRLLPHSRGLHRSYAAAALARALMLSNPSLAKHYLGYASSLWEYKPGSPCWITGDDALTLKWSDEGAKLLHEFASCIKNTDTVNALFFPWGRLISITNSTEKKKWSFVFTSPFRPSLSGYCMKRGLKHTLAKDPSGGYKCVFTPYALKKRIISNLSFERHDGIPGGWIVNLETGQKFEPHAFMAEAFELPDKRDWVRIEAEAAAARHR